MTRISLKRRLYFILSVLFFTFSFLSCTPTSPSNSQSTYWLTNLQIWDGVYPIPYSGSIKIQDGKIADVVRRSIIPAESKIPVLDRPGLFAIPGLINVHVHVLNSAACKAGYGFTPTTILNNLRDFASSGFTTVADMGAWPTLLSLVKEWSWEDPQLGPRVFMAGPVLTVEGGYPDNWLPRVVRRVGMVRFLSDQNIDKVLDLLESIRIDYLKVGLQEASYGGKTIPLVPLNVLKELVDKAHQRGKKVFVHALTRAGYSMGLAVGADAFIHGSQQILGDELVNELADRKIPVVPTMWVWKSPWAVPEGLGPDLDQLKGHVPRKIEKQWDNYINDYKTRPTFPSYLVNEEGLKKSGAHRSHERLMENMRELRSSGVPFAFGTDAPYCFNTAAASFVEMEELKRAGFKNQEILVMATMNAAHFLGEQESLGSIEKGKRADLVLLKGNPLLDLKELRNPEMVIRDGREVPVSGAISLRSRVKIYWLFVKALWKTFVSR